ncbi:sulfotransferase family protein [Parvularcula lutaonensis]|uniref:Sulfotransferase family protein n=1 Tax=Parvularcula lutaonensis TaxID=491923 RepID=A0ABV7MBP0_9PROT|nr:sulfotransferase [Parvularcula lutaonensis]GGY40333.1 hypothetical protein GCM10007148_06020 [Parvularcula lutaonensis]
MSTQLSTDDIETRAPTPRERPHIVLCGSLRAGTTMLRLMLGRHPLVEGLGESDFLFDGAPIDNEATPERIEWFRHRSVDRRPARCLGFRPPTGERYVDMLNDLIAQHRIGRDHLLITLHRHFDIAARMLPNAFFIRLQRDPRDVALSAVPMGWGGIPYFGLDVWMQAERDWLRAKDHIPEERRAFIRYEDLVRDPRGELSRVLDAAGLPFDKAVLAPGDNTTYAAPKPREHEAFRRKLSEREIREINARLAWLPEDYGYNLSPAESPSAIRSLELRALKIAGIFKWRLDRYGLGLTLADVAGRKLGLKGLEAKARREMRVIDAAHLK